jgi:hypothetical protein
LVFKGFFERQKYSLYDKKRLTGYTKHKFISI